MKKYKKAIGAILLTILSFSILSCDIELINRDIELEGTPCYFSDEWSRLYYRDDPKGSIGIGSGGIIYHIYWNDSMIVVINDTMKYEIITLINPKTVKKGVPWKYTGYLSKEELSKYPLDFSKMKHIDLSDYHRWEEIKKNKVLNKKIESADDRIDSLHFGQELNRRLKEAGLDTMENPYLE